MVAITPQSYRPRDFCQSERIGLSKFWAEVRAGRLRVRKAGRVSLVFEEDRQRWRQSLPVLSPAQADQRPA